MYLSVFYALQIGTRKKVPFIHSFAIDPNGTQIETPMKKGGETITGGLWFIFSTILNVAWFKILQNSKIFQYCTILVVILKIFIYI